METIEKPLPAKVKVVKEEPCELTFAVDLPREEVARETTTVFEDIQRRAALPGFRAGKAPMELIQKNFSQKARQAVLENLIARLAAQVLRDRKLQTLDTPRIEKIDFELGKPLSFTMKVEKDPEIRPKDYKGIKVTRTPAHVADAQVQKTLEDVRDRNATLVASNAATVESNHFVVIDFEGKIEGKPFPGGSAKNYLMDMNAPQTITGFNEGLRGARIAEPRTVTVKFPGDYPQKEWAGKEAIFTATVKEIKEKKLPALDDEFAKDLGTTSLDDLRKQIRDNLEKEEAARVEKETEDQLFQALLESNRFPIPATLLEDRIQALIKRTRTALERQGLLQPKDSQADAALRERVRAQAEKDVRLSYILKAIAEHEKLMATPADTDVLKQKALQENADKRDSVEAYFKGHGTSIQASLTEGKVMDFLKKNAKIKVKEA